MASPLLGLPVTIGPCVTIAPFTKRLSRGGLYQAGDIGCTTLRVVQDAHVISLGRRKRALEAQSIEGDTLELLDTQAAVVRGRFVCVGAGCVIDRVEYSEDLTVEDGGIVKEPVRC